MVQTFSLFSLLPFVVMAGIFILVMVRLVRWFLTWLMGPEKALAPMSAPQVGRITRMLDMAAVGLWPFRPPQKVRMAFPCPACCMPLLGKVSPGEELVCPWCATTFQTPEPPPAAPPVSKKVLKKAKQAIQPKGSIFWRLYKFACITLGICVVVSLVIIGILDSGYAWLILAGVLAVAWLGQALQRRFWHKEPFLPKPILAPGGGNALATEAIRTVGMVGAPITLCIGLWTFLAVFAGCLFPLIWRM